MPDYGRWGRPLPEKLAPGREMAKSLSHLPDCINFRHGLEQVSAHGFIVLTLPSIFGKQANDLMGRLDLS